MCYMLNIGSTFWNVGFTFWSVALRCGSIELQIGIYVILCLRVVYGVNARACGWPADVGGGG